ncbi:MAG: hypothetical protein LBG61_04525 [Burkholderiales bacterium]|jgi:hypothetical protein|nr:hypothetical protein [Burkholderiales bacterium]
MSDPLRLADNNLYPRVRATTLPDPTPSKTAPLWVPWHAGLSLYCVQVGEDGHERVITQNDLPQSLGIQDLFRLAVKNLDNTVIFNLNETDFAWNRIVSDGHEANALCLNRLWVWLVNRFDDDVCVALPAENEVLILPASDQENVTLLKAHAAKRYALAPTPLLETLLIYRKEGEWMQASEIRDQM